MSRWIKGEPRRTRTVAPVTMRFEGPSSDGTTKKQTGKFVFYPPENAWVELIDGEDPDGFALYPDDGYKILAWRSQS